MPAACDPVRAAMKAWRDGGPPPDRDPDVAAHLGQCDACGAALEDLVGVSDEQTVARAFASIETRPGFAGRVLARLAGATEGQAPAAAPASTDDDAELDALLAAGARFAGLGPAGRSGMGMVIEYCAVCRERIDAADFRSGVAIQFKGQSYCRACKEQVVAEFADDPEYQAQQRRAQQAHARPSDREESDVGSGIRPGMGRAVRREPAAARRGGAGGPNVMLLGGIAAGVLVLIVAGFFLVGGSGKTGAGESTSTAKGPTPRGGEQKKPGGSGKAPDSQGKKPGPSATPEPAAPSMEDLHRRQRAVESLRQKREDVAKFAKENEGPENWQDVDLRYRNFLEDGEWTAAADDPAVKELRAQVENDKKMAQQRYEVDGNEAISRAISRAMSLATGGRFDQAMRALDDVPMIFSSLDRWKELGETRAKIDEIARKKMGVQGEWFDVVTGSGDTEKFNPPTNDQETTIIGDAGEKAVVIRAGSAGTSLVFTSDSSGAWADYEVEFEAKASAGTRFAFRVSQNPGTGQLQGIVLEFDEKDAEQYRTYLVRFVGNKWTLSEDGVEKGSYDAALKYGKPLLLLKAQGEIRFRSLRYKVLKLFQR